MINTIKIGTWNLCLGLANKKDTVTSLLNTYEVGICCLQETEIPMGFPENVLNSGKFLIELENNIIKKRVGIYVRKDINYIRRYDLEKSHLQMKLYKV